VALELVPQQLAVERPDPRLDRVRQHAQDELEVGFALVALEQLAERDLQVLERVERQVEADGQAAEDEVRDPVEGPLARQREPDLVDRHVVGSSVSASSSASSSSRRAAASFASATASPKPRRALRDEAPCAIPAAKPESF